MNDEDQKPENHIEMRILEERQKVIEKDRRLEDRMIKGIIKDIIKPSEKAIIFPDIQ